MTEPVFALFHRESIVQDHFGGKAVSIDRRKLFQEGYHQLPCVCMLHAVRVPLLGPGMEPGADLGPVTTPAAKQRILDLVTKGEQEGAEVLLDGRSITVPGYERGNFVGPTLLHKVRVWTSLIHKAKVKLSPLHQAR